LELKVPFPPPLKPLNGGFSRWWFQEDPLEKVKILFMVRFCWNLKKKKHFYMFTSNNWDYNLLGRTFSAWYKYFVPRYFVQISEYCEKFFMRALVHFWNIFFCAIQLTIYNTKCLIIKLWMSEANEVSINWQSYMGRLDEIQKALKPLKKIGKKWNKFLWSI